MKAHHVLLAGLLVVAVFAAGYFLRGNGSSGGPAFSFVQTDPDMQACRLADSQSRCECLRRQMTPADFHIFAETVRIQVRNDLSADVKQAQINSMITQQTGGEPGRMMMVAASMQAAIAECPSVSASERAAQSTGIVGRWERSDAEGLITEFRPDGTWTFYLYNSPNAEGRWSAIDEDEFRVENSTTGESAVARIVGSRLIGLGRDHERM